MTPGASRVAAVCDAPRMAKPPAVHLICTQEPFAATELLDRLRASMPADAEVLTLSAEGGEVPGLDEALFAPSLFAVDRLVVVRDAERLQAAGVKRIAEAAARGGLVGVLAAVAVSERPPAGLVKAMQGVAKIHRLTRPRRGELVGWVGRRLTAAGLSVSPDVPGLIVEAVGAGLGDLAQAVDQLAVRAGTGGTIGGDDVVEMFPRLAEQPVWALFDALSSGDGHKAFRVLHALLAQGEDPIGVLFALVSQLRYAMRARSVLDRSPGCADAQLASALGVSPGRAGVLRRQAGHLSWEWLIRVHEMCADADFQLKGGDEVRIVGVLPPEIVLERLVDRALPASEIVLG